MPASWASPAARRPAGRATPGTGTIELPTYLQIWGLLGLALLQLSKVRTQYEGSVRSHRIFREPITLKCQEHNQSAATNRGEGERGSQVNEKKTHGSNLSWF